MDTMDQANTTDAKTVEDHTTVAAEKTPGSALLERLPSARKAVACDIDTHTFMDIDDPEELRKYLLVTKEPARGSEELFRRI